MPPTTSNPVAAFVRSRKPREKDKDSLHRNASVSGSSSSRRPRDQPRLCENKSPPPESTTVSPSCYQQPNVTLEQVPPSHSPDSVELIASASSKRHATLINSSSGVMQLPPYHHTPAALQQYLEVEIEPCETASSTQPQKGDLPGPPPSSPVPALECTNTNSDIGGSIPPQSYAKHSAEHIANVSESPQSLGTSLSQPNLEAPVAIYPNTPQFNYSSPLYSGLSEQFYAPAYPPSPQFIMAQTHSQAGDFRQNETHPEPYFAEFCYPHPGTMSLRSSRPALNHPPSEDLEGQMRLENGIVSDHVRDDDAARLLNRLQSAIPDLHLLLSKYREASGQLELRDNLLRQSEAQKAHAMKQESYINRLVKELEKESQKHSTETTRLRNEIGNLEEKHKKLVENLLEIQKSRGVLHAANHELEKEKEITIQKAKDDVYALTRDHEEVYKRFEAKERMLRDDLNIKCEAEKTLIARVSNLEATHARDWENMDMKWRQETSYLQSTHVQQRQILKETLQTSKESLQKTLDQADKRQEAQRRDHSVMIRSWEEERDNTAKYWEERFRMLSAQYEKDKNDAQDRFERSREALLKGLEEERANMRNILESCKVDWHVDKTKFIGVTDQLTVVASKLSAETDNLQRIIEAFGSTMDLPYDNRRHAEPMQHKLPSSLPTTSPPLLLKEP